MVPNVSDVRELHTHHTHSLQQLDERTSGVGCRRAASAAHSDQRPQHSAAVTQRSHSNLSTVHLLLLQFHSFPAMSTRTSSTAVAPATPASSSSFKLDAAALLRSFRDAAPAKQALAVVAAAGVLVGAGFLVRRLASRRARERANLPDAAHCNYTQLRVDERHSYADYLSAAKSARAAAEPGQAWYVYVGAANSAETGAPWCGDCRVGQWQPADRTPGLAVLSVQRWQTCVLVHRCDTLTHRAPLVPLCYVHRVFALQPTRWCTPPSRRPTRRSPTSSWWLPLPTAQRQLMRIEIATDTATQSKPPSLTSSSSVSFAPP